MTTTTEIRRVRCSFNYFCGASPELIAIAHQIADGVHHRTQSGESDESFLERVAAEITAAFLAEAGESTGADGFAFETSFAS